MKHFQPRLEKILEYRNESVIKRFLKSYNLERSEAEVIFQETLKMLYLKSMLIHKKDERILVIVDRLFIIDEMWHNFILFTKEYRDFCK